LGIYRDRLDIIADILEVASRNAKKTQIMYQANLSYKVLIKYLAEITEASLVDFHTVRQSYFLTQKGREFLETYRQYSKNSKNIEKRLNIVNNKKKALDELCPTKSLYLSSHQKVP
jgi:predicted transcriptional regulator